MTQKQTGRITATWLSPSLWMQLDEAAKKSLVSKSTYLKQALSEKLLREDEVLNA